MMMVQSGVDADLAVGLLQEFAVVMVGVVASDDGRNKVGLDNARLQSHAKV
jgi:hypothetical protein